MLVLALVQVLEVALAQVLEVASVPSMAYSMEPKTEYPKEWTREVQMGSRMDFSMGTLTFPLSEPKMVRWTASVSD